MEAEDLPEHRAAQHQDGGSEDSGRSAPAVSRGDLIDDYTLPPELRDPEESERTPLPELPDRDEDPLGYRRPYYDRLREELDRRGSVTITGNTHVGSVRGYHVVQEFRSAVRRHPDDSLEQYEFDDGGGCPVEIRRAA